MDVCVLAGFAIVDVLKYYAVFVGSKTTKDPTKTAPFYKKISKSQTLIQSQTTTAEYHGT